MASGRTGAGSTAGPTTRPTADLQRLESPEPDGPARPALTFAQWRGDARRSTSIVATLGRQSFEQEGNAVPSSSAIRTAIALFLVALALRPQVVGIGPLLPLIQGDLGISHGVGGLLGTIPVLCMGVFALVAPWLGRLLGTERAIAAGVAAIGLFGFLRVVAPDPLTILVLTVGVGVGIAVVGPLLPIVVRHRAPARAALASGVYAGGIVLGATLSGALAVPLAGPDREWRLTLAAFSAVAVGSVTAWLVLERPGGPEADAGDRPVAPRLPWGRPRAWAVAFVFGAQSVLFYAAVSWLPTIYVERGWSPADAGLLLALMNATGLVATFGGPALAERFGSRRGHLLAAAAFALVGLLGVTTAPALAVPVVVVLGIGLGSIFPLVLALPVDLAERREDVGGLAAIMLFGGYVISSVAPVALGLIRDATGGFELGLWLLIGTAVVLLGACWWFVPAGLGRRVPGDRHRAADTTAGA